MRPTFRSGVVLLIAVLLSPAGAALGEVRSARGSADLLGLTLSATYRQTPVGEDGIDYEPVALVVRFRTSGRPGSQGPTLLYRLRVETAGCASILDAAVRGPAAAPTDPEDGEVRWRGLSPTCPQGRSSVTDKAWKTEVSDDGLAVTIPFDSLTLQDLAVAGPGRLFKAPSASVRALAGPTTALVLDETGPGANYEIASDVPADVPCTRECPEPVPEEEEGFVPGVAYEFRGNAWISMELHSEGADVGFLFDTEHAHVPVQVAGFAYTPDTEEFMSSFTLGLFGGSPYEDPELETHLELNGEPLFEDVAFSSTHGTSFMSDPSMSSGGEPVTLKLVMAMAGSRLGKWSFTVKEAPGVEVRAYDVGSSASLLVSRDFSSVAQTSTDQAGFGTRAVVAAEREIRIRDTLIGAFTPVTNFGGQSNVLSVTTPSGDRDCELYGDLTQRCDFQDFRGPAVNGPGAYTFRLTGAGAGVFGWQEVMLFALDARLPESSGTEPEP